MYRIPDVDFLIEGRECTSRFLGMHSEYAQAGIASTARIEPSPFHPDQSMSEIEVQA
jgi:hypothetical protein